jgi:cytosine/adenosine deaminase-related metal-dependent hydrolase
MTRLHRISRRRLLSTAAAVSAATLAARPAPAQGAPTRRASTQPPAQLPPRPEFVVRGAMILTMDPAIPDLARGDVHVRDGQIVAVGADVAAPGAEVVDGRAMIALPGLVETHFHMWNTPLRNLVEEGPTLGYFALTLALGQQYTPTDMYRGVRLAAIEALDSGITTVHDWAHNIRNPAYADADLRALVDTGIRARFSYGTPQGGLAPDDPMDLADLTRMHREWAAHANGGLLTLGMASRSLSTSPRGAVTVDALRRDWDAARAMGLPITIHTNTGIVTLLEREGLLDRDVQLVNPSRWNASDLETAAHWGLCTSIAPFSEMRSSNSFVELVKILQHGIVVSMSIDTPAISGNSDMFAAMHALLDMQFAVEGDPLSLTARQVLELATINGARDLGIADRVGSLTPGKRADLILVRTTDLNIAPVGDPTTAIVRSAQPHNVDTVIVDGRILKRGGQLTAVDPEQVVREAAESLAGLRARAGGV